jgi:hypothetical protein
MITYIIEGSVGIAAVSALVYSVLKVSQLLIIAYK